MNYDCYLLVCFHSPLELFPATSNPMRAMMVWVNASDHFLFQLAQGVLEKKTVLIAWVKVCNHFWYWLTRIFLKGDVKLGWMV